MEIHSDRHHDFAVPVAELWDAIVRVDDYQRWWPWLTTFEADGFATGSRWRCVVRPPLRYTLEFELRLDEVVEGSSVAATVSGDIAGHAHLVVEPTGAATSALELESRLHPVRPLLKVLTAMARPVATSGHDWVIETGLQQFEERAVGPGRT